MERPLSSLTHKGSIPEAINEAKKQKKLFVVYISGEDTESNNLENTTWTDLKVAESVSKYCILLYIREGSTDAANFCAIYPQNSIPCITAIGYNGLQVWRSEGFVSAEVLASSLEKAWFSLHIQETTASVLTAALASNKSEPPTSGTSDIGSSEQGSYSGASVPSPSPSLEKHPQSSDAKSSVTSEMKNSTEFGVKTSSKSCSDSKSGSVAVERSSSSSKGADNLLSPAAADPEKTQAEHMPFSAADSPASRSVVDEHSTAFSKGADNSFSPAAADPEISQAEQKPSRAANAPATSDHHSSVPAGDPTVVPAEANKLIEDERADDTDGKVDLSGCSGRELSDVHLNIRLPNGVSLREKFTLTSALRVVKDYVDRNQTGLSSYDLAVPYPRKVFTDEDLSKSLSDLSLFNRQALIVVPRQRASGYHGGGSSISEQTSYRTVADSSSESEGGYFAYVRRILSYANPLSYFSGGASSSPGRDSQRGIWEYGPNPTLQNNLAARGDRPNSSSSNISTSSGRNESKNRPPTTSRFGSNIHTLKHDEDDSRFNDRNAFWNGNSTQYGGDNNGR